MNDEDFSNLQFATDSHGIHHNQENNESMTSVVESDQSNVVNDDDFSDFRLDTYSREFSQYQVKSSARKPLQTVSNLPEHQHCATPHTATDCDFSNMRTPTAKTMNNTAKLLKTVTCQSENESHVALHIATQNDFMKAKNELQKYKTLAAERLQLLAQRTMERDKYQGECEMLRVQVQKATEPSLIGTQLSDQLVTVEKNLKLYIDQSIAGKGGTGPLVERGMVSVTPTIQMAAKAYVCAKTAPDMRKRVNWIISGYWPSEVRQNLYFVLGQDMDLSNKLIVTDAELADIRCICDVLQEKSPLPYDVEHFDDNLIYWISRKLIVDRSRAKSRNNDKTTIGQTGNGVPGETETVQATITAEDGRGIEQFDENEEENNSVNETVEVTSEAEEFSDEVDETRSEMEYISDETRGTRETEELIEEMEQAVGYAE